MANNFPTIRPSLLMDYENSGVLDPRVTFTRAGQSGGYFDGKTVAKAEENLFVQSNNFPDAAWLKSNSSFSGTVLTFTSNGSGASVQQTLGNTFFVSGSAYAATFEVKAGTATHIYISGTSWGSNQYSLFEFSLSGTPALTRSFVQGGWTIQSNSVVDVGGGWYRISCLFTAGTASSASSHRIILGFSDGTAGVVNDGRIGFTTGAGQTVEVRNAQLEQRSFVTAYTPTTTQPITNYIPQLLFAPAGVPVIHVDPVTGRRGLRVEPAATNLLQRSQEFDDAYWTKTNATISADQIVAPDGTLTADKLVETTANGNHDARSTAANRNGAYAATVFAKAGERTSVRVFENNGFGSAVFNLQTGVATLAFGTSATMRHVGNGWYRCILVFSYPTTASSSIGIGLNDGASNSYTGDGTSGIYIWGAQLEAGSAATSYIPTVASQVTRLADSAVMTGGNFSSWYRADEGTFYVEASWSGGSNLAPNTRHAMGLSDGTSPNQFRVYNISGTAGGVYSRVGGVDQIGGINGAAATANPVRSAVALKLNDAALGVNGIITGTDTSCLQVVASNLWLGNLNNAVDTQLNGTIYKLAYYPARLANAQLQALTR